MVMITRGKTMGRGGTNIALGRGLVVSILLFRRADCIATCSTRDDKCWQQIGPGSICREDKKCTVPDIEKGCLQALLPEWKKKRVCNSEDPSDAAEQGLCEDPELPYTEVRLYGGNWESRAFEKWLVQIILSEILGVPATVEGGTPEATLNLYDSSKPLNYGVNSAPDHHASLKRANEIKDCTIASRDPDAYEACAHGIFETWSGPAELDELTQSGVIEAPTSLGMIGQEAVYVTKFTLQNDTSLGTYLGLQGEEQRRRLAEQFLRPTTWKDYCDKVSSTKCARDDGVAKRYPQGAHEEDRMFVDGNFIGHFMATEENDCSLNNDTFKCTGHIGDFPCRWTSFVEPNMHYLGIPLKSSGRQPNSHGYTYRQQVDMWHAANATRSNLIMYWWTPEPLYQHFANTSAEMMKVAFPVPTQQCLDNRVLYRDKCHESREVRLGSPLGVCEEPVLALQKLVVSSLRELSNNPEDPVAIHSPAYELLRWFQFSEYQLSEISALQATEPSSRQAVCRWATQNMDYLQAFVPKSYPRTLNVNTNNGLGYATFAIAACVALLVCLVAWRVHKEREEEAIKLAQVRFLQLLLCGSMLISFGAIITSMKPTNFTCTASIWFVNIGYTLELVPLIVKVGAICRIMQAAQKMQRIVLGRQKLYGVVGAILFLVLTYLAIWTGLDHPRREIEYILTGQETENGETVVQTSRYCASKNDTWEYIAVGWNVVLLFIASVWAFQMRRTHAKLNETGTLAFMIYSHFVFVMLRVATFMLSDNVEEHVLRQMRSLIFSSDTIATILIYFIPKLDASKDIRKNIGDIGNLDLKKQFTHQRIFQPTWLNKQTETGFQSRAPDCTQHSKTLRTEDFSETAGAFTKEISNPLEEEAKREDCTANDALDVVMGDQGEFSVEESPLVCAGPLIMDIDLGCENRDKFTDDTDNIDYLYFL